MPLTALLDAATADGICARLLAASADPELLAAALRAVRTERLLPAARAACTHPEWTLRTQAVTALGRLGAPADRVLLLRCLRDPQWWVRYRAAQALTGGRFGPAHEISALAGGLGDRFAADIVAHVLAERAA